MNLEIFIFVRSQLSHTLRGFSSAMHDNLGPESRALIPMRNICCFEFKKSVFFITNHIVNDSGFKATGINQKIDLSIHFTSFVLESDSPLVLLFNHIDDSGSSVNLAVMILFQGNICIGRHPHRAEPILLNHHKGEFEFLEIHVFGRSNKPLLDSCRSFDKLSFPKSINFFFCEYFEVLLWGAQHFVTGILFYQVLILLSQNFQSLNYVLGVPRVSFGHCQQCWPYVGTERKTFQSINWLFEQFYAFFCWNLSVKCASGMQMAHRWPRNEPLRLFE